MIRILLPLFLSLFTLFGMSQYAQAQSFCNSFGNLVVISNYDGGIVNINVDMDIPNLKIGLSSYEPMTVNIGGPFAANVTEVWFAGYNDGNNHNHCAVIPTTTVSAPAGTAITIETYPPVTLPDPAGENNMIYCYQCSSTPSSGNTPEQLIDYFTDKMGGILLWHNTQYGCYGPISLSGGGNCCLGTCTFSPEAGQDSDICTGDTAFLNGSGADLYFWSPPESLSDSSIFNPLAFPDSSTTYYLTAVNADGCTGVDSVRVNVLPVPPTPSIIDIGFDSLRCSEIADSYTWFRDGIQLAETGRTIFAGLNGDYRVFTTVQNCPSDTSASYAVETPPPPPSGIDDSQASSAWTLFPNPNSGMFSVRLQAPWPAQGTQWRIMDITGRLIKAGQFQASREILTVEGVEAGMYLFEIESDKERSRKSFVVSPE